jgi:4-hydroxy-2-oxoheptanedioate aldolase
MTTMPINAAQARLAAGDVALGLGIRFARTIDIAKLAKVAGYDWLFIDLEHGAMSLDTACQIANAANDAGIAPMVRVPKGEFSMATRALDNGAMGIVIPHVDTTEEAFEIVRQLRLPPVGRRSLGPMGSQIGYATLPLAEAAVALDRTVMLVAMLETAEAVQNASAIAAVPGIDALLLGTNDLSAEYGLMGQLDHPQIRAAAQTMVSACKMSGKTPGVGGIYDETLIGQFLDMGVTFVLAANDMGLLQASATNRAIAIRRRYATVQSPKR